MALYGYMEKSGLLCRFLWLDTSLFVTSVPLTKREEEAVLLPRLSVGRASVDVAGLGLRHGGREAVSNIKPVIKVGERVLREMLRVVCVQDRGIRIGQVTI